MIDNQLKKSKKKKIDIIVLLGPTAIGKTDIAFEIAKYLNYPIISADALQIYKELSIGTAAPEPNILEKVKHYLIGEFSIKDDFSVIDFYNNVLKISLQLQFQKIIPFIVGGSGFYINTLLKGYQDLPDKSSKLRESFKIDNSISLWEQLKEKDSKRAEQLAPNDEKRIIRALEIINKTKKSVSENYQYQEFISDFNPLLIIGLNMDRKKLYQRIENRVDIMVKNGLFEEVKDLYKKGFNYTNCNALKAIGYYQVLRHYEGEFDYTRCIEIIKRDTRRFAKRQLTWFRKIDKNYGVNWYNIDNNKDIVIKNICSNLKDLKKS